MSADILRPNEFEEIPGRLRIGVDLDGVTIDLHLWLKRILRRGLKDKNIGRGDGPTEYWLDRSPEIQAHPNGPDFFRQLLKREFVYQMAPLIEGAVETLNSWRNQGFLVYFITARYPEVCEDVTLSALRENNLGWAPVFFPPKETKHRDDFKSQKACELRLHAIIDDYAPTIRAVKLLPPLMAKIIPNRSWNKAEKVGDAIRCGSWKEIDQVIRTASWLHYLKECPQPSPASVLY